MLGNVLSPERSLGSGGVDLASAGAQPWWWPMDHLLLGHPLPCPELPCRLKSVPVSGTISCKERRILPLGSAAGADGEVRSSRVWNGFFRRNVLRCN